MPAADHVYVRSMTSGLWVICSAPTMGVLSHLDIMDQMISCWKFLPDSTAVLKNHKQGC